MSHVRHLRRILATAAPTSLPPMAAATAARTLPYASVTPGRVPPGRSHGSCSGLFQ